MLLIDVYIQNIELLPLAGYVVLSLLAAGTGAGCLYVIIRARRKRQSAATVKSQQEYYLQVKRICGNEYKRARAYLNTFTGAAVNAPFQLLPDKMLPTDWPTIHLYLYGLPETVRSVGVKTKMQLLHIRDRLHYQERHLKQLVAAYPDKAKAFEQVYYENLYSLSQMHDELSRYMQSRAFDKSNGVEWYEGYFSIFGAWFRSGAQRDMQTTYEEIVVKVMQLNILFRFVPFVIQTTACTLKCDQAYKGLLELNNELAESIKLYERQYKLAYRTAGLLTKPWRPASSTSSIGYLSIILLPLLALTGYVAWPWLSKKNSRPEMVAIKQVITTPVQQVQPVQKVTYDSVITNVLLKDDANAVPYVFGIDVSRYQGNLLAEIEQLDSLHFIICKASEGEFADPRFFTNWQFIRQKGLIRGAYHFFRNDHPVEAQAHFFTKLLTGLDRSDLPPIVDIEAASLRAPETAVPALTEQLLTMLRIVEKQTGRQPIIYSNLAFADEYLRNDSLGNYPLWLAEYSNKTAPAIPITWRKKGYVIWQKSDHYSVLSRRTDFDIFNGDGRTMLEFIRNN